MSWKFDYLFYKDFFQPREIQLLNQYFEANHDDLESINNTATGRKKTRTLVMAYFKVKHHLKNIENLIYDLNERNFGYDINPIKDGDCVLLNVYDSKEKGKYDWHVDSSRSDIYDTKLTVLVNVSTQKYEGGEFSLFSSGSLKVEELDKPGNLIIIKSSMNHKVDVVTKGKRKTLTLFINGPKFR